MKTYILLFIILLGLVGCASPYVLQPTMSGDILVQANAAQATQDAIKPYLDATSTTAAQNALLATRDAAATVSALSVETTRQSMGIASTQAAYNLYQTQAVNTQTAQAAERYQVAMIAQTQTAWPPTATAQAALLARIDRERQRSELQDKIEYYLTGPKYLFWAALPMVIILGVIIFFWRLYHAVMPALEVRTRYIRNENGQNTYVTKGEGGTVIMATIPSMPNYSPGVIVTPAGILQSGMADPGMQQVANYQQLMVDLARYGRSPYARKEIRETLENLLKQMDIQFQPGGSNFPQVSKVSNDPNLPSIAPWGLMLSYNRTGLPVGLLPSGNLLDPNIDESPHRLFGGMTGAGKSRFGARPAIATALAQGFYVLSLGDLPAPDFTIFQDHPNFRHITVYDSTDITKYIQAAVAEIRRRWQLLEQAKVSTWGRLPNASPRVMIVIDEYAALVENLIGRDKNILQGQVTNLSRLGRKSGIHLLLGVQNPTADNIRISIRRNMFSVMFKTTDHSGSLAVLGSAGAETLSGHQFLARAQTGEIIQGVAFDPNDNEITDLLDTGQSQVIDCPGWIESAPELPQTIDDNQDSGTMTRDQRIIDLYRQKYSLAEIQRLVMGYSGGHAHQIVKSVVDEFENTTTTTV